jgi:hypothetical protein
MEIKRINQTLEERAEQEYANSTAMTNAANIEYIAMMSDIDLPTENDETGGTEHE